MTVLSAFPTPCQDGNDDRAGQHREFAVDLLRLCVDAGLGVSSRKTGDSMVSVVAGLARIQSRRTRIALTPSTGNTIWSWDRK